MALREAVPRPAHTFGAERRRHERLPIVEDASCRPAGEQIDARTWNVSRGGRRAHGRPPPYTRTCRSPRESGGPTIPRRSSCSITRADRL